MEKINTDLVVIGAGPGGYVAAIRAAKLGVKTIIVEKENLGGVCLNTGCIPTKALYYLSQSIDEVKRLGIFGLDIEKWSLNFKKTMERKDYIVNVQRKGIQNHLDKNGVKIINGEGKLIDSDKVIIKNSNNEQIEVKTQNIIIATGSTAKILKPFNFNSNNILDNVGILSLKELPESLLIIGGGIVGCEFANIFVTFGSEVTIVETLPRILSSEDEDIAKIIQKNLLRKSVNIYTGTIITGFEEKNQKLLCKTSDGSTIEVEKVLVSIGRAPNISSIGIEDLGIDNDNKGFIKVDAYLRTSIKNIYAIGDVSGKLPFAHVASKEGKIASQNIAGIEVKINYRSIPWGIFTTPEIGAVGLTETQAKERGLNIKIGIFPFSYNGKAHVLNDTEGFVRIISDATSQEILGARIIGPRAVDLIHEIAVAMQGEITIDILADTVHSHPTLSEAVMEAAEDIFNMATHKS